MILSYKLRIYPNSTQEYIINRTLGACRFIYNNFLFTSKDYYNETGKYLSGYDFSKKLTVLKKEDDNYSWLTEISSKAIRNSIMNADKSYRNFFKGKHSFPKFKSKKDKVQTYFFIGDNVKFKDKKVTLPILGKVRFTEEGYIPIDRRVIGGTIKKELDEYYAIFRIDMPIEVLDKSRYTYNYGKYGIDVGIKEYLTISDKFYNISQIKSFLKLPNIVKLEKRIEKLQKVISHKMEYNYGVLLNEYLDKYHKEPNEIQKNIMKGKSYSNTCRRLQNKISKLKKKINNIKMDYINKIVSTLVKLKPKSITVETLDIKDLLENDSSKTLHKYIHDSKFYYFFTHLQFKCYIYGIELRKADKYFASSKICSNCGNKKKDLKLSDRIYHCECCGYTVDRDVNASFNLVNLKKNKYSIV